MDAIEVKVIVNQRRQTRRLKDYERLRKCRLCRVRGRKAIFHRWTEIATVVEPSLLVGGSPGGQTNITLAIVEYKNGKVEQVYPGEIKFLDTQVNWPEQEK